ncbi:MAG: 2-amino-4-hydroxy-6-hydroxymethyldihydropteridine diphosphokinase [Thermoanaerobaculia bacterium]|nr:2-amino-4-hydroxy-6-hydroxymethyldihydropteridine diphosphokinase [Thermoanaerobaculia bacterium]
MITSGVGGTSVFLGLGSNLDDPPRQLRRAVVALSRHFGPLRVGPLFLTEPDSEVDQPDFLNTVVEMRCALPPLDLLTWTQQLETDAGRTRGPINGPRPLDVDLLLFGGQSFETEALTVPHPRIRQRAFVLRPLAALAPDLLLSETGPSARGALEGLQSTLRATRVPWSRA